MNITGFAWREFVPAYAFSMDAELAGSGESALVPIKIGDHVLLLSVEERGTLSVSEGQEWEIASREPRIEQVLDGIAVFAGEVVKRLRGTNASKITVEFGCQVAVESGVFLAVIGKASAASTLKVGLEWSEPAA